MPDPERSVPRATYAALGITTALYVAIAIGVFGTLTVAEVIENGDTALAEAARPSLGEAGFVLMAIAALLATSSSVNANIYAAKGVTQKLTDIGQFPPFMAHPSPVRGSWGIVLSLALMLAMAVFFDLTAIASIGSAVALTLFMLLGIAAFGLRSETRSQGWIILLATMVTGGVLVIFVADTLESNPETFTAMLVIAVLAVVLDVVMRSRLAPGANVRGERSA
jgi:amino acid transporter